MKMSDNGSGKTPKFSFAVIKHRGSLNECTTADGYKVQRQDRLWVEEPDGSNGRLVACAPDDIHFIFIDPTWTKKKYRWFAMCSCGSPASIIGYNAYSMYGSPTTQEESTRPGEMLICMAYATNGAHLPVNWGDGRDATK